MQEDTKQEIKYIGLLMIFVVVFFSGMYALSVNGMLDKMSPVLLFLISNVFIYIILFVVFKNFIVHKSITKGIIGSMGSIILFIAFDLLLPPYSVSFSGQLLTGTLLGSGSSDYFFGYIYNAIGIHGMLLFFMVYFVTFFALLIIGALLVQNIVKEI